MQTLALSTSAMVTALLQHFLESCAAQLVLLSASAATGLLYSVDEGHVLLGFSHLLFVALALSVDALPVVFLHQAQLLHQLLAFGVCLY